MKSIDVNLSDEAQRLGLASADMKQAAAAARQLRMATGFPLARAMETAIAVCYWRPFSDSSNFGKLKKKWRPQGDAGRKIHRRLKELRNIKYAHTDPAGDRVASATLVFDDAGEFAHGSVNEQFMALHRDELPPIIELCEEQAQRFLDAAFEAALESHRAAT